ncbi:MAG: pentapeptide repeat-containing protein [Stellaceae bacterium]
MSGASPSRCAFIARPPASPERLPDGGSIPERADLSRADLSRADLSRTDLEPAGVGRADRQDRRRAAPNESSQSVATKSTP